MTSTGIHMPETHGTGRHQTKVSAFLSTFTPKGEHMNREAMKQQILEALSKKLGDGYHGTLEKVQKTNIDLDGLTILKDGETITPTIYLEPFYKALENGVSVDDVTDRILYIYFNARTYKDQFDITSLSDFGYVKNKLYVQLINRHLNKNLLRNIPHTMFLDDFAVAVRCTVEASEENNASFMVHNSHLNIWQADSETVLSLAISNTLAKHNVDLMPLEQLIRETGSIAPKELPADCRIWFMSSQKRYFGAAAVLSDDVLKDFADKHGSFYVIFSSVHEVLLMPSPNNSGIDSLTRHNQDVNAMLSEEEILGTKAYFYQKDRGFVL